MTKAELEVKCKILEERLEKIDQITKNINYDKVWKDIGRIAAYCDPECIEIEVKNYMIIHKN